MLSIFETWDHTVIASDEPTSTLSVSFVVNGSCQPPPNVQPVRWVTARP